MSEQESIGPQNKSFRERIVRILVERKHKKVMVDGYWNIPEYKKDYVYQTRVVSKLLKIYSKDAILNVVTQEAWCYSLNNQAIQQKINIEQIKIDRAQKLAEQSNKVEPTQSPKNPPQSFRKKQREKFTDG